MDSSTATFIAIVAPFVIAIIPLLTRREPKPWVALFTIFLGATIASIAVNWMTAAWIIGFVGLALLLWRRGSTSKTPFMRKFLKIFSAVVLILVLAGAIRKWIVTIKEEKLISVKANYAALWLGSRIAPAVRMFEEGEDISPKDSVMLETALLYGFDKYKQVVGLDIDFAKFFYTWSMSRDSSGKLDLGESLAEKVFNHLQEHYGKKTAKWWMLGLGLSASWNQAVLGGKAIPQGEAVINCSRSLKHVHGIANVLEIDKTLISELELIIENLQKSPESLAVLRERIDDWIASVEMELLISKVDVSPKSAKDLIGKNPNLAVVALKDYLEKNPNDAEGYYLVGAACAALIVTEGISIDPLRPIGVVETMEWSLRKQIQLDPTSEKVDAAKKLLVMIRQVLEKDSLNLYVRPHGRELWSDDFEDGNLSGWKQKITTDTSHWLVENGRCVGKGVGVLLTEVSTWHNYVFEVRVRILEFNHHYADCRVIVRHQATPDRSKGYHLLLSNGGFVTGHVVGSDDKTFFVIPFRCELNRWYRIRVHAENNSIKFYIDDVLLSSFKDSTYMFGGVGLGVAHAHAQFDDVIVRKIE
jgi:hypothetical protein